MKTRNRMLAALAGSAMLACGMAHGAPWNEDDVVMTDGDTVLAPTTYENVSLTFDGEAAGDGDAVAVFRDGGVFCGYGEVYRSNLEIVLYAAKGEQLSLKAWRSGTPDTAVLDVTRSVVGGEAGQLLAPNPGDAVSGLALAYEPAPETHTLTFDAAGGSAVAPITQASGTAVTAPAAPARTGYTFTGWSPGLPAAMPAEDMTLTAQWKANQYTVTFDANGGSVSPSSKTVTYDFKGIRKMTFIPKKKMKGDVNGDNFVNMADVNNVVSLILAGTYEEIADVNNDGLNRHAVCCICFRCLFLGPVTCGQCKQQGYKNDFGACDNVFHVAKVQKKYKSKIL